ncbi:glycosyltransferase family 2 protein [Chryseolinea lacunae]|uniref:Glycosyltransferase family 2 protein n=1 Tax=Chryseolinea lacunae TaxID=2801331 RepID=A0ABS1KT06_9BACT|nr:glycosyltransferase family 2 protein [Chryseolinea lacunae]MBL0742448.1 glycosyltransferase family 2 protein [Chryseolinea lacunae]
MKASVIVPTYQGHSRVLNIAKALMAQTFRDFELIFVVDGSTDGTGELLRSRPTESIAVRIVEQENKGRAGARNAGVAVATGDVLIFYDDDMLPMPDSVERHIRFHEHHPNAIVTGHAEQAVLNDRDFEHYRAFIHKNWMMPFRNGPTALQGGDVFMTAANCSMTKATFAKLNGFDSTLKDAEDRELAFRAFKQHVALFVDLQNAAWHCENLTCRIYIRRLRQYAVANHVVGQLHPDMMKASSARHISSGKKLVYRLLASPLWVSAIDGVNVFRVLPTTLRYKLYDAITFSLSEVYKDVKL